MFNTAFHAAILNKPLIELLYAATMSTKHVVSELVISEMFWVKPKNRQGPASDRKKLP